MDNFNLRTFLAEGKLSSEMQFDSDIEGKTNKNDFAFWYRAGARGKAQALKAQELLQQNGIDADYSKGPFYIDFSNANVEQRVVHQMLRDAGLANFVITNLSEGQLNEDRYDIDDPNSPLGKLNDNDQDVSILNNMIKKYGKDVVLMWMSSGDYGERKTTRSGIEYVSEGPLNEAMSPQDVVDIADTVAEEFTKESADEGDFLVYSVGRMEGMSFELDTDLTSQSPKGIDMRGVGEGWGGIFRIKPTADGYEVRNAEKGGLVAMIDGMGNFKMLSADESRAEMGLEENKNELKSNKMKKSELKEMIKSAFLNEKETFDQAFDRIDKEEEVYPGEKTVKEEEEENVEVNDEENVDVNVKDDVEVDVDDESVETDTVVKTELPGEDAEVTKTLGLLTKAQQTAKALGDAKLTDQIGNTITYFTRAHVARQQTDEVKVNEVTFPMWNKINK